jgi:hypothetical protein
MPSIEAKDPTQVTCGKGIFTPNRNETAATLAMFQAMVNFFYVELQDFWLKSGTFGITLTMGHSNSWLGVLGFGEKYMRRQ